MTHSKQTALFLSFCGTIVVLLFFTPLLAVSQQQNSRGASPDEIVLKLQKTYDDINSLSFSFTQLTQGQLTGRPKEGRGKAIFIKEEQGGKMRWDYFGDEKQVIVSDGQDLSMYFAKLHQMIITPAATMKQDIMYSFFTGSQKLQDNFNVTFSDSAETSTDIKKEKDLQVVKLIPKETQSQISNIHLFITKDSLIRRIEIKDHFDTLTVLNLTNLQINSLNNTDSQTLNKLFTFSPPKGTEIIRQ